MSQLPLSSSPPALAPASTSLPVSGGGLTLSPLEPTLSLVDAAVYDWQIQTDDMTWSNNAQHVFGLRDAAAIATGKAWEELVDSEAIGARHAAVMGASQRDTGEGVPYDLEYPIRLPGISGSHLVWVEDIGRWFADSAGKPVRAQGMIRIVTERHETEQRLSIQSRLDPLTGAFNRPRLINILNTTISDAKRYQTSCAFLLVALENIGGLNEAYGLQVVDELIAAVAKRLRGTMRAGDALGRFSTTTFGMVLANCTSDELLIAGQRFLNAIHEQPISTENIAAAIRVSMGGVAGPRHARTANEMMLRAGETLEEVRSKRRGTFMSYDPAMSRDEERQNNLKLAEELLAALNERRITLALQPVVKAMDATVQWHEVLARVKGAAITDAVGGYVLAAEKLGLVHILDRRILELACQALESDPKLHLAINLSPATINDPDWREFLDALLATNPDLGQRLMVEVTETTAFTNLDQAAEFVNFLRGHGICVAIDDFGAGHTSFRSLRALGVDIVKIDGDFVLNSLESEHDRAFVRALVALAREVGFTTVAECVESREMADLMCMMGVDHLQGHYFGGPVLRDDLVQKEQEDAPALRA